MKTYTIECRRVNTPGNWLTLGSTRCGLEISKLVAKEAAIEFRRTTRVVSYGRKFRICAEFDANGDLLFAEED
jgi:hypothetical protein